MSGMLARAKSYTESTGDKAKRIRAQLGLPDSLTLIETAAQAEQQLCMDGGTAPLSSRINALLDEMGIGRSAAVPVVVGIAAEQTSTVDVVEVVPTMPANAPAQTQVSAGEHARPTPPSFIESGFASKAEHKKASGLGRTGTAPAAGNDEPPAQEPDVEQAVSASALGTVASVGGRRGTHVDQITIALRDGNILKYGTKLGRAMTPKMLREGEYIFKVIQRWSGVRHGSCIEVVLRSQGQQLERRYMVEGTHTTIGDHNIKVKANEGCEIVGLHFEDGMLRGAQVRSGSTGEVQTVASQSPTALGGALRAPPKLAGSDADAAPAEPTPEPAPEPAPQAVPVSSRTAVKMRPLTGAGADECFIFMWVLHVANVVGTVLSLSVLRAAMCCDTCGCLPPFPAPYPFPFAGFLFFFTGPYHYIDVRKSMDELREKVVEAPMVTSEAKLRDYVQAMQTTRVELCFHVKCSHYETRRAGKHGTKTEQIVTHEEDSPILRHSASADYTCTDQSSITTVVRVSGGHIVRHMSPDNLSGDGSLQTGKQYAVVQSGLTWESKTVDDQRKLMEAKKRCFDTHHHKDDMCDVTVVARLPGMHAAQIYTSEEGMQAQPPWPLRFLDYVEPLLAVFGLSLPLLWLRGSYFKGRRIDHRVHKVISFA